MLRYQELKIPSLADLDFSGKTVLIRVDFNVPIGVDGAVEDASRVRAALPTLEVFLKKGAKVILISHLGRPKGKPEERFSLAPVATCLAQELGRPVVFLKNPFEEATRASIQAQPAGSVILLENLRFFPEEEANDAQWAQAYASLADLFVNDAFGTLHRAHASTDALARCFPAQARGVGYLVERELEYLVGRLEAPERPFAVVLGGAKVSDKIKVIEKLLEKADMLFIGGAMAYTFALARGETVGKSLCEPDCIPLAQKIMQKAKERNVELFFPKDFLITDFLDFKARTLGATQITQKNFPEGWEGVDIGPETLLHYAQHLKRAKTIFWNGPMGVFEVKAASKGTMGMAVAIRDAQALSIIGGGDSVSAAHQSGCEFTFISTGGGASLALLEGDRLPGLVALAAS